MKNYRGVSPEVIEPSRYAIQQAKEYDAEMKGLKLRLLRGQVEKLERENAEARNRADERGLYRYRR